MNKLVLLVAIAAISSSGIAKADVIGDFRIDTGVYSSDTALDPGADHTTRSVVGAPVQVNSTFSVASQNIDLGTADPVTDVRMRTFSSVTQIRNLSRFTPSTDGVVGVQRVGVVQWNFDLTPIDSYLATNGLTLTTLDLDLDTIHGSNAQDKKVDVYLSYTNAGESIAIQSIENSAVGDDNDNWNNFYLPARGSSAGSIVGGTHKILALESVGDLDLNESLLALYNSGVREFNLVIATGDFWSGRTIDIGAGSGLTIETSAVPEPTSAALLFGLSSVLIASRRRK